MKDVEPNLGNGESKGPTVLVAIDLSHCSRLALKKEERMKKISFQKFEHMILPRFRQDINEAESTEDIRKAFVFSIIDFFENAFGGCLPVRYEDVEFRPYEGPYFYLSQRLLEDEHIRSIWKGSDLRNVIARLAEQATNHYRHFEKHHEKTNAKIRTNISA